MSDPVTLDDLPPIDFAELFTPASFGVCYRCSNVVMWTDEHREAHERWHAAVEALAQRPTRDAYQRATAALGKRHAELLDAMGIVEPIGFYDALDVVRAWHAAKLDAHQRAADLEPPFGLRQALLDALQVEDTGQDVVALVRELRTEFGKLEQKLDQPCGSCHPCANWADETWRRADRKPPHVHEWDEAQAELTAFRSTTDNDNRPLGPTVGDLARLAIEYGCQPDGNLIEWFRSRLVELDVHRKHECSWTTDQVNARVDERRAGIIALLEVAARGRDVYSEDAPDDQAVILQIEANTFRNAANLVRDPTRLSSHIPVRMFPEAGELTDDELELAKAAMTNVAEVCPSLYYRELDRTLYACTRQADQHKQTGSGPPGDVWHSCTRYRFNKGEERVPWTSEMAVPVPWPLDQEPPAGINLLADTGPNVSQLLRYLCRATNHWVWSDKPAVPHGPYQMLPWAEAVLDADGDLHVVRP